MFLKNKTKKFFDKAEKYTKGIFLSRERNIERICESHHYMDYYRMQHFISDSNWDGRAVIDKSAMKTSQALPKRKLTGLIIDETGTVKKGDKSVGVGWQYYGNVGKPANSQVAVMACLSNGDFSHGPDGTSLSYFTSETGLGDWELVDAKAVDPNPDGSARYGVGDATIAKIDGHYYLYCDRESKGSPYKIVAWKSEDINAPFEFAGQAILPRWNEEDDWDNHRIQDADIAYIPSLKKYVMVCNMKDIDGNPGDPHGNFESSHLGKNETRVVGFFYSKEIIQQK